jgi:hypothetical protein
MWLFIAMDALSDQTENSGPPEQEPPRRRRRRAEMKMRSGNIPVLVQMAIIVGAFGIGALLLLFFFGLLGQAPHSGQADQRVINAVWVP